MFANLKLLFAKVKLLFVNVKLFFANLKLFSCDKIVFYECEIVVRECEIVVLSLGHVICLNLKLYVKSDYLAIKEISLSVEARSSLGLGVGLVHDCVTVLS